jgi:HlyD family secretion protein
MKRALGWILTVAFVAAAVLGVLWYRKKHQVVAPKYATAAVDRGRVASKVTATGTLSARVTVQVGSQVSGRLQDIFVDFNSQVKKGQIIAKIDPRLFEAALQKSQASYAQAAGQLAKAKVNVQQAERNLERSKKLRAEGLLGDADLELAQTAVDSAQADVTVAAANVASAGASLSSDKVNLGFTTIISPIDGIVISRSVDVGQTVAASLSAPVLFTIAEDLKNIQVDTFVAEADVGKLRQDMEATFTVDAYPGETFKGKVRVIRNAATTVQNVVTYDGVIDVANPDLKLKPGMTANVSFIYAERPDVVRIPNTALRFRATPEMLASAFPSGAPSGSHSGGGGGWKSGGGGGKGIGGGAGDPGAPTKKMIWVLVGDRPEPRRIETGISDGTFTEVVSGELAAGDQVITEVIAPSGATSAKPTGGGGGGMGGGGGGLPRKL